MIVVFTEKDLRLDRKDKCISAIAETDMKTKEEFKKASMAIFLTKGMFKILKCASGKLPIGNIFSTDVMSTLIRNNS